MNGYNFTEQVRRVLSIAREEAAALRHEYLGTEHILLGLIHDVGGVSAQVFEDFHVNVNTVRQRVLELVQPGKSAKPSGPDLPYTSRAKRVLELSMKEARDLGHTYVGTEHLLLGLIIEEKGVAAQVLAHNGMTAAPVRADVVRILGSDGPHGSPVVTHQARARLGVASITIEVRFSDDSVARHEARSIDSTIAFLRTLAP